MSPSEDPGTATKKKKPAVKKKPKGVRLVIDAELCKGCGFCVEFCPTDALALSAEFNRKGYHPPVVNEEDCIYCEVCELICPEFSIFCVDENEVPRPDNGGGKSESQEG